MEQRYWPALDGLRALAVIAVLLFHGGVSVAVGGYLGVSLFFTLSGFLITRLVLEERERTGTVRVREFWARRARRLLPASLAALTLAAIVTMVAVPAAQRVAVAGDIRAALFDVFNWRAIATGTPYVDLFSVPSPVQHFWSLAIEEQFYLVFPLVAAAALRRRPAVLGAVLATTVALSFLVGQLVHGTDRAYFGTDTRAAELAIGGLLALGWRAIRTIPYPGRHWVPDALGWGALAATLLLWWRLPQSTAALYRGGLVGLAVVSAALLFGAVEGRSLPAVLGVRPLVALGRVSYGIYVFHFPLYVWLSPARTGLSQYPLLGVRIGATLALAVVSFHVLEWPIRRRSALPRPFIAGSAFAVAAAALLFTTAALPEPHGDTVASDGPPVFVVPTAAPAAPTPVDTVAPDAPGTVTSAAPTTALAAPPETLRAPRLLVIGDSTAVANGYGLQQWSAANGQLVVQFQGLLGCPVLPGLEYRMRQGWVLPYPKRCGDLFADAVAAAHDFQPDAVVVWVGTAQLADIAFDSPGEFQHIGESDVDSAYLARLAEVLDLLGTLQVPVLWADVAVPAWDLDVVSAAHGNLPVPGVGPVSWNDADRTAHLNAITAPVLASRPFVRQLPYAELLAGADGTVPSSLRPDGLHLSAAGVATIADAWLIDQLIAAYRAVEADPAAVVVSTPAVSWR